MTEATAPTAPARTRQERFARAGVLARTHAPLLVVLAFGLILRIYLLVIYQPLAGGFNDSVQYLQTSSVHLFGDPFRMAGYPLFLKVSRGIYGDLTFVVALQHLLGLLTAVALYATLARITGRRWIAAIPALVVATSIDQLLLEHSVLTETLFTFLLVTGACCIALAPTVRRPTVALVAAGLLLGTAATVRTVALPLVVLGCLWLFVAVREAWKTRALRAASLAVPAVAVLLVYIVVQGVLADYWGLSRASGWALYTRVAPIADCGDFTPPAGTEALCEDRPVFDPDPNVARSGPGYYQFIGGPAIETYGNPFQVGLDPKVEDIEGRFARAVILNQPIDYLGEVLRDMGRYVSDTFGFDRFYAGAGADELDISRRAPEVEAFILDRAATIGFKRETIEADGGLNALQDLQRMLRVDGFGLIVLLVFGLVGALLAPRGWRAVAGLLLVLALAQAAVPVLTISWGFRYGIPSLGLLAGAAAIGLATVALRIAGSAPSSPAPDPAGGGADPTG